MVQAALRLQKKGNVALSGFEIIQWAKPLFPDKLERMLHAAAHFAPKGAFA